MSWTNWRFVKFILRVSDPFRRDDGIERFCNTPAEAVEGSSSGVYCTDPTHSALFSRCKGIAQLGSACMACKRSAVRSRTTSPPKKVGPIVSRASGHRAFHGDNRGSESRGDASLLRVGFNFGLKS